MTVFISGLISCSDELDMSGLFISPDQVNERFEQSVEWNSMHAGKVIDLDTVSYTFLAAGDCHVGGISNMEKFSLEASRPGISFFVLAGDLTTGHKEDYDILRDHLDRHYSIPCFLIAGNHDLYFNGWSTYYDYFGSSTYTFTIETPAASDLFICLDSGSGTLGDRQLNWLSNILADSRSDYRNCIIVSHSNFFRSRRTLSTTPLVEELYYLLDLFSDYHVDMVIMGHDHERSVEIFGNTTYLTLDAIEDDYEGASYARIDNENGALKYRFNPVSDID
ncbi:MAG: metallophosphoesterase [Bacteroidales bacterium]|nr:metallophosphoesterase [Bacteroidales bacterium]